MSINIINRALIKLGQPTISSVSQEPNGRLFGIVYEDIKNWMLSQHPWRFAIKRVVLAPDEEKPISGFAYAYTLPSDFLGLYSFGKYFKTPNYSDNVVSSDQRYSIEGDKILCDVEKELYLTYMAQIKEADKFSPSFREALIAKLAAEYAPRVKQSTSLAKSLNEDFLYYLQQAEFNNEMLIDVETTPDGSWVGIREGWSNGD
jgi:hypothetical protein